MSLQPETIRLIVTVLSLLIALIFNVFAILKMWSMTKIELSKLKVEIAGILANNERIDKDFKLHERLNEQQFQRYHEERKEDFNRLNDKLDKMNNFLIANK